MNSDVVRQSKFLSKYLRHEPEALGLKLETGGWVRVDDLLKACANNRFPMSREELEIVVATNNKKRFAFNDAGDKIRASQGHSTDVDLQLKPVIPPSVLYHGTSTKHLGVIMRDGLKKMSRHHVHLSVETSTASNVGARHGKPVVFRVDAEAMHKDGYVFYVSDNGVWLTDNVPAKYLDRIFQADVSRAWKID